VTRRLEVLKNTMKIIKQYKTTCLCGTCYRDLLGEIQYRSDGAAYLTKNCPEHGYQEAMVEKDYNFWEMATQRNPNEVYENYNNVTVIEVTDRCNVECEHCYHIPDNGIEDKPVDWILKIADQCPTREICLMGAEPTVRQDLPEIIKKITALKFSNGENRLCSIYTNGVKLQNKDYLETLINSGITSINMSIHTPDYHNEKIWKNIDKTLINLSEGKIVPGQLSFTVESKDQMRFVLDKIYWLINNNVRPFDFCIRSPSEIGLEYESSDEIFASDLAKWAKEICEEKSYRFEKHPNRGSNPYHVAHVFENIQNIQIIHWANVKSVDTSYMYMGPYATFMPNTFGTFSIQTIMRDGLRKGWYQGHRVLPGPHTRIARNESIVKFKSNDKV
jgi:organic radical activating enzyme